jgi:hypothetical protein
LDASGGSVFRIMTYPAMRSSNRAAASTLPLAVNFEAGYNATSMSALFDELEKQARLLTPQEKARLASILIEELDPSTDSQVEQLWIAESQRRYQAYLNGEIKSLSGNEVMSRARSRLK